MINNLLPHGLKLSNYIDLKPDKGQKHQPGFYAE
jgi:hypothetical protein